MEEIIKTQNGYKIFNVKFKSIPEFLTYIGTARKITSSNSSDSNRYDFTRTKSLKEAIKLCRDGFFDKTFSIFKNVILESISMLTKDIKPTGVKNDVLGFAPNVPYFLQGNPFNMFNYAPREVVPNLPRVNLYYNVAERWDVPAHAIIKKGLLFLALYELLKNLNIDVNLIFTEIAKHDNFVVKIDIDIQREAGFNINELYFPLVHPSFLRRLIFAYEERCPFLKNKQDYFDGYGTPVELDYYVNKEQGVQNILSTNYGYSSNLYDLFVRMIKELYKMGIINKPVYEKLMNNLENIKQELYDYDREISKNTY